MIQLEQAHFAELRPWFTPEEPGPITLGKHLINTGHGRAWVDRWPQANVVLVEVAGNYLLRGEPSALSESDLRDMVHGFLDAPSDFLPLLEATFGPETAPWERIIYELEDFPRYSVPDDFLVRRLAQADTDALTNLSHEANWIYKTWPSAAELAASGYAWGAFTNNKLVSVACTFFLGDEYEDIGVVTEPEFRGLGLNVACSGGLCADIQARGHIPSWSTSTDNLASRRVAEKLGFTFSRNDVLYLIGIDAP
jgi:RimJ/RimL family protein N-acetyltransferase